MNKKVHPDKIPYLLVCDKKGNIFEDTAYYTVGKAGNKIVKLLSSDFIELPFGSDMFFLPGRNPVGLNIKTEKIEKAV